MTLTSNFRRAVVVTHTAAEIEVEKSVGSKDRVETGGRTRPIAVPCWLTLPAGNKHRCRITKKN